MQARLSVLQPTNSICTHHLKLPRPSLTPYNVLDHDNHPARAHDHSLPLSLMLTLPHPHLILTNILLKTLSALTRHSSKTAPQR